MYSRLWSEEEDEIRRRMVAERYSYEDIGLALDRPPDGVKRRCKRKKDITKYSPRRGKRWYFHDDHRLDIPDEVLADRERRLALFHTSITAIIAGDPLPGMSALDRRHA